jgi:murein endopeptidase
VCGIRSISRRTGGRPFTTQQREWRRSWTRKGGYPLCYDAMRLALTALVALTAASAAAQDGVSQQDGISPDGVSVTEGDAPEEAESAIAAPVGPALLYTRELTDHDLAQKLREDPASLGSISIGFADRGRIINAVQMPQDPAWIVERPDVSYAVRETVDALAQAFRSVRRQFPDSGPARLNHISAKDGGALRPHRSHQSGRDADIGLFYKGDKFPPRGALQERFIDPARNCALLRALITETDVQLILVDRAIQAVLLRFALSIGEDAAWLAQVFGGMVKHARSHRDHFHVRFFAPRSQELGRRVQPMLALLPGQNLTTYVVRSGNTLREIATRYKTTVAAIRRANQMKTDSLLRLGQQLVIPLRGACTICPLPPPLAIPARLLPPEPPASLAQSWLGGINPELSTAE